MKKQLVALALIMGLAMATGASADWGKGNRGNRGYGNCPQMQGQMLQQLDQATQDKIKQFYKDTLPLHKEMAMKRAEKQALMRANSPDSQAVAKVTGELFDLRAAMQEKAEQAGVSQYVGPGHMGGMGRMGGMRQMGCGPCGGQGWGMGQGPVPMNDDDEPQQKTE
ncbi:periplasmic heavy metal sensor [Desulfopila sp. IMCC35006]|uniref:periplasmic heavy metal sensor n=1 Tax=Desulfopila sp. IMCC35006 TaxID=2569542 RepID=UPI0010ACBA53|nr:periplasmic heavy metal sensor [Desulfopila sp. IMCC35006]TKB28502.1 periplasmic heavy metal sensor [Desulfopila sp. IMCC35006]